MLDRFGDCRQGVFVGSQVRREATFVTHGGVQATGLQHGFQVMEDLGAHAQCVGEVLGADRLDHELLDIDVVVGVFAAVDDVHHRNRHGVLAGSAVEVGDVRVERYALGLGSSLGGSQGHGEDGVGAQLGLVLGTVEFDHRAVQSLLVSRILAQQQVTDRAIDVGHGLQYALAQVTALVAIAQLEGFAGASGGTGRRTGAANDTAVQDHIRLNGRVAAGVQDLTALDVDDLCHSCMHSKVC
ncbi:hypothetical protein D3C76_777110 [compost metagenome]